MIFGVAEYETELKLQKFKMADPISQTIIQKVTWLESNLLVGSFEVVSYEPELKIQKFGMADPIWWIKMQTVN